MADRWRPPTARFLFRKRSLAAMVALAACSNGGGSTTDIGPPTTSIALTAPVASTAAIPTTIPTAPTTATPDLSTFTLAPDETLVAESAAPVDIYESPAAMAVARTIDEVTILGSPTVFRVETGPLNGWVQLALPGRPNGAIGWAKADQFQYRVTDQIIRIDLSNRSLSYEEAGEEKLTTAVAVGSVGNPTPAGLFFVTDVVQLTDPSGPWGPFAFGLSARSDTITEFNGGDGIIGIHGTNRPAKIGEAVSLGCVRVPNEVITRLVEVVDLGVPVLIEA
jgi:lipoprotein-anchoring transpeptidase ErfK/SrfK